MTNHHINGQVWHACFRSHHAEAFRKVSHMSVKTDKSFNFQREKDPTTCYSIYCNTCYMDQIRRLKKITYRLVTSSCSNIYSTKSKYLSRVSQLELTGKILTDILALFSQSEEQIFHNGNSSDLCSYRCKFLCLSLMCVCVLSLIQMGCRPHQQQHVLHKTACHVWFILEILFWCKPHLFLSLVPYFCVYTPPDPRN